MEIFEVAKDKLGLDSKRYTTLLFVCSVALPVSLMILIMYQNQLFPLTGGLAKAEKSRNVAALNVDSKNDSSPPAIIPDGRLHNGNLPPGFGNGTSSENNSLRHTSGTDKQLNGAMAPGFWIESGSRNDSFGNETSSKNNSLPHTSGPDEKQLNGTLAPGFQNESDSRNYSENGSLPHTSRPNVKHNETLDPGFQKESDSRNYSENGSLLNTSRPNVKQLNETLDPGFQKQSDSRNYSENGSLLNTSRPNVKQLNETLDPGFRRESGSRNDSSQGNRMPDDKLLDGLLAPGFDERSCASRYQSFLFRKTSLHKPSSYLLSKLRRYEDIHKRCGPHSKSYNKALKRLRSSHDSRGGCKYIVWIPSNGLGNRMLSMAATFLYALLTNRVLLVNHKSDMANLFCEPFLNTSWLLPEHFPLRNHHFGSSKHRYAHSFGSMLNKSITNTSMEPPEPYLDLNLALGGYDQLAFCDENQALLQKIPWLILLSDQYFVPSLFMIPSFNREISKLFPEKETVFYHLGHYLFHPSNQVWGLITRFYQAYLAKADERIGLQIRVYHDKTTPFQTVMDQILDCVLKEKLLPEVADTQEPAPPSRNQTSKAILITSLYSEYYENMKNMYWTRPTVTGEVISVYQPSHEAYQHFGDNMHNMKAWADIYLLSLCDVLVTSTWSTFGYVAHGLAGLKPWIWRMGSKNPACQRAVSMEPCCHFPLSYDCKTRVEVNAATLVPNTMHCEDRKNGLKLV